MRYYSIFSMGYFFSVLFILFLFLPTFIGNGLPIVAKNIPFIKKFSTPVSEKYLWKNKTYRGFIAWIWWAILTSILQYFLSDFIFIEVVRERYIALIHTFDMVLYVWILQGVGALWGDAIESFFKRKIWKKPGEAWLFFDGVDYIIGSVALFSLVYVPNILAIFFLMIAGPVASAVANIFAYCIKWKDVRY